MSSRIIFLLVLSLGVYASTGYGLNSVVPFQSGNVTQDNNTTSGKGQEYNATSLHLSSEIVKIEPDKDFKWIDHRDILPKDYAQVFQQPAPVYSAAWSNTSIRRPKRVLDGGFIWVSLESPVSISSGNSTWFRINKDEFIEKQYLAFYKPSTFKGVDLEKTRLDGMYGWLVLDTYTAAVPGKQDYMEGELLDKHLLVKIQDQTMVNGQKWLKLADKKWVEGSRVALITRITRPSRIPPGAKWIDINIYEQVLCAYEGDKMVYATLISTGLPSFDTPTGVYRIWGKARMRKMSGGVKGKDYYFLEDVPYQMYFSRGIAIHAAYWHDNFGIKQSHGCVNVSPRDAKWLFDWTRPKVTGKVFIKSTRSNPGTYIYVH